MPARLAQHLVTRGLLSIEKVEEASRHQALAGGQLDTALLELGAVAEAGMLQALGDVAQARPVNLSDFEPNRDAAQLLPAELAQRLCAVPLSVDGDTLHLAIAYPVPHAELEAMRAQLGRSVEPWVALEVRIREWMAFLYGIPLGGRYRAVLAAIDPGRPPLVPPAELIQEELTLDEKLAQELGGPGLEPIPLTVKKRRPGTQAGKAEPLATRVLDAPLPLPREALREEQHDTRVLDSPLAELPESARDQLQPTRVLRSPLSDVGVEPPAPPRGVPAGASEPTRVWEIPAATLALATPPAQEHAQAQAGLAEAVAPRRPSFPSLVIFSGPGVSAGGGGLVSLAPPQSLGGPTPTPPAAPPVPPAPAWTPEQARAALRAASRDRDEIVHVALRYALATFHYAAAFAVLRGVATYWDAQGENAGDRRPHEVSIPLDAQSLFGTVALTRASFIGPTPNDSLTRQFLAQLGRKPRTVFLFPVEVRGRLVCLVYGDAGSAPISQRRLSDFLLFCQELSPAFAHLLVERKRRMGPLPTGSTETVPVSPAPSPFQPSPAALTGPGAWTLRSAGTLGTGRAATLPGFIASDEPPAPDFAPLLQKLTGPDAVTRARALAELCRTPRASARYLAQHFPGPVAWSRLPVVELPEAEELGPLPAALGRLGRSGAQALVPLLDHERPDVRYFALLTAGSLPYPELVSGVLRGLFDEEPDVSSAARAAAVALKRQPRFEAALADLRRELVSPEPLRRALAARAAGALRDRSSVAELVGLASSDDEMCAQAAVEALRDITKRSFGADPARWVRWWGEHKDRARADWLVEGLRDPDVDVRLSALEELVAVTSDNLGFFADAPLPEREAAVSRWEQALVTSPRLRTLA